MENCCLNYTAQTFKSDQEVKWCPGCGDHAILNAVQRTLPQVAKELNCKKEDFAFISGIGCSSRFIYYMNTYGFHTIHGRAAAIATGVKLGNPKLSVWQVSGDGDALAIGGNHFIHAVRRNININMILFNNQIYGLTKGQYSPTSEFGKVTKTSPYGTIENPFTPGELVMGARGNFFARTIDVDVNLTVKCLTESAKHKGYSVTEVMQNCVIYNNGAHKIFTDREVREDRTIVLEQGKPMIFGKNKDKGLVLEGLKLKVVTIGEDGYTEDKLLVHDAEEKNPAIHTMLVNMKAPEFPIALGIIRKVKDTVYDDNLFEQLEEVKAKSPIKKMDDLLNSGNTWTID